MICLVVSFTYHHNCWTCVILCPFQVRPRQWHWGNYWGCHRRSVLAVNLSLLLRQFDELWCLWVFWMVGLDITFWNPIDFIFLPYHSCCLRHWVGCLVIRVSFWSRQPWWRKLDIPRCIKCHPCLIIDYLVLYFGLSGSMYPDFFVIIIILRRLINLWRYFVGISWGFFSLVIWKPPDSWNYFQEFVLAIASIAFSNGATNCNNFPFLSFLLCV